MIFFRLLARVINLLTFVGSTNKLKRGISKETAIIRSVFREGLARPLSIWLNNEGETFTDKASWRRLRPLLFLAVAIFWPSSILSSLIGIVKTFSLQILILDVF